MQRSEERVAPNWRMRSWFDWLFALASFLVFICLEGALLYAYYTFLNDFVK